MNNKHLNKKITSWNNQKKLFIAMIIISYSLSHLAGSENIRATTNMLTQKSYTSSQIQDVIALFDGTDFRVEASSLEKQIPTPQEILDKINELEKLQDIPENTHLKERIVRSLHAALAATNKVLVLTKSQKFAPLDDYEALQRILESQQQLLSNKTDQYTKQTKKTYWSNSYAPYMLAGIAVSMIATGIGISYYYSLFDILTPKKSEISIIFTGQFDEKRNSLYTKMSTILAKFIDPNDKQSTSVYLNQAKNIIQELDPVHDAPVIEMLNTFIESQKREQEGMFTSNFYENAIFWKETHSKKAYYTQILTEILNHDTTREKKFASDDLDIRDLLSQKNKYNESIS